VFSGIACSAAEAVTLPIDVVKTRLQIDGELGHKRQYTGSFNALRVMARTEGIGSWWKGISPAILRQATYGTIRYGAYEPIKGIIAGDTPKADLAMWQKLVAGTLSGAISSSLANPTDLVKVRMQADMGTGQNRRYTGMWSAFRSIWRAEGWRGLYRGVGPTSARASVGAATELATYDEFKGYLTGSMGLDGSAVTTHLACSLLAGFITTLSISPFDVVKSRVMNQPVDASGKGKLYSGMLDCFAKSIRSEGPLSLWNGFLPNYARVGPRVVIIFMLLEQLRIWFD
jgi:hypothetical protein